MTEIREQDIKAAEPALEEAGLEQARAENQEVALENADSSSTADEADDDDEELEEYEDEAFTEDEVSFFKQGVIFSEQPAGTDVLFSPGSVFVSCGELSKGGLINLALSFAFLVFFLLVTCFHFFPIPGFLFLLTSVLLLWIGFALTRRSQARKLVSGGKLFHLSFSIITFWFPLLISFILAFGFVMQRTWMGNDTMLPSLHKGDFVLVDRLSYVVRTPSRGDLVLVESVNRNGSDGSPKRRIFFARILASPGDSIQLMSGAAYINDTPLSLYIPKDSMRRFATQKSLIAYESPYGVPLVDPQNGEIPDKWYPIQLSSQMLFTKTDRVTLKQDQYYVIEDNRNDPNLQYMKSFGSIVHVSSIKGQPLYVIYNSVDGSGFERFGLRLR